MLWGQPVFTSAACWLLLTDHSDPDALWGLAVDPEEATASHRLCHKAPLWWFLDPLGHSLIHWLVILSQTPIPLLHLSSIALLLLCNSNSCIPSPIALTVTISLTELLKKLRYNSHIKFNL